MKKIWIPQLITTLMLLWALTPDNPYGYYILLRLVCCTLFAFLALQAVAQDKQCLAWTLGITAAIYNPIIRVHFTREIWSVVNIVTIIIAVTSIFILKSEKQNKEENPSGQELESHNYRLGKELINGSKSKKLHSRILLLSFFLVFMPLLLCYGVWAQIRALEIIRQYDNVVMKGLVATVFILPMSIIFYCGAFASSALADWYIKRN